MSDDLAAEAAAFDDRIHERVENGFVPDLRNAPFVPWFFNNPWRHPELADMVFGEYLRFGLAHLPSPPARVLEVACGPGHLTLEFAREGYDVTGLDLSPASIQLAEATATDARAERGFGALRYEVADFLEWDPGTEFDAVCFFLALHHFEDLDGVVDRVHSLLRPEGRLIVVEPARDWFSQMDGAIAVLVRSLLSARGSWYDEVELAATDADLDDLVQDAVREFREARDRDEGEQSPHDNDSAATDMVRALAKRFDVLATGGGSAIVPRIVGGIRGSTDEEALAVARFVKVFDDYCTRRGLLQPGVMYYAGRRKET